MNLLVDRAVPDAIRRHIDAVAPDVVVVQELGERGAPAVHEQHSHGKLDPREDLFGLGIVANRAITVDPLPLEDRPGWVARLDPDDWPGLSRPIEILDVHLRNPIVHPWRETQRIRRAQVSAIAAYVESTDAATVIIGDMNTSPIWPEYRMLLELGVDAAKATGTDRRTWAHILRGPRWIRIDHAFVAGATPVSTSVARVAGTDHSALTVDLEV